MSACGRHAAWLFLLASCGTDGSPVGLLPEARARAAMVDALAASSSGISSSGDSQASADDLAPLLVDVPFDDPGADVLESQTLAELMADLQQAAYESMSDGFDILPDGIDLGDEPLPGLPIIGSGLDGNQALQMQADAETLGRQAQEIASELLAQLDRLQQAIDVRLPAGFGVSHTPRNGPRSEDISATGFFIRRRLRALSSQHAVAQRGLASPEAQSDPVVMGCFTEMIRIISDGFHFFDWAQAEASKDTAAIVGDLFDRANSRLDRSSVGQGMRATAGASAPQVTQVIIQVPSQPATTAAEPAPPR